VVIGENKTYLGGEAYLKQRGVEVVVLDNAECRELMEKFIAEKPDDWLVVCFSTCTLFLLCSCATIPFG
jgi:hypothetical protein